VHRQCLLDGQAGVISSVEVLVSPPEIGGGYGGGGGGGGGDGGGWVGGGGGGGGGSGGVGVGGLDSAAAAAAAGGIGEALMDGEGGGYRYVALSTPRVAFVLQLAPSVQVIHRITGPGPNPNPDPDPER
jgi:hypothetical protein